MTLLLWSLAYLAVGFGSLGYADEKRKLNGPSDACLVLLFWWIAIPFECGAAIARRIP